MIGNPQYDEFIANVQRQSREREKQQRSSRMAEIQQEFGRSSNTNGIAGNASGAGRPNPYAATQIDPTSLSKMSYMNYDAMRNSGNQNIANAGMSGYQSTLGGMSRSGGLRAADRLAAGNEMQKNILKSQGQFQSNLANQQAQNRFRVDQYNTGQDNKVNFYNNQMTNQQNMYNDRNNWRDHYRQQDLDFRDRQLAGQIYGAEQSSNAMMNQASQNNGLFGLGFMGL